MGQGLLPEGTLQIAPGGTELLAWPLPFFHECAGHTDPKSQLDFGWEVAKGLKEVPSPYSSRERYVFSRYALIWGLSEQWSLVRRDGAPLGKKWLSFSTIAVVQEPVCGLLIC